MATLAYADMSFGFVDNGGKLPEIDCGRLELADMLFLHGWTVFVWMDGGGDG